jgi:hypothetical protein
MASPSGAAVNAAKKWAVPQSDTKVSIPDGDGPSGRLPTEVDRNVINLPDGMRIEGDSPHISSAILCAAFGRWKFAERTKLPKRWRQ